MSVERAVDSPGGTGGIGSSRLPADRRGHGAPSSLCIESGTIFTVPGVVGRDEVSSSRRQPSVIILSIFVVAWIGTANLPNIAFVTRTVRVVSAACSFSRRVSDSHSKSAMYTNHTHTVDSGSRDKWPAPIVRKAQPRTPTQCLTMPPLCNPHISPSRIIQSHMGTSSIPSPAVPLA